MDAVVKCATMQGVDGRILEVTAHSEPGLPGLEQRGLPGHGLGERAGRLWSAVTASGLPWPKAKVTVTVAPGWLAKHEGAVDLAMAVAVLAADGTVLPHQVAGMMFYAGLVPDGALVPVPGVLAAAAEAGEAGCRALVVAAENAAEARLVPGVTVICASRLAEVAGWLRGAPIPQATTPRQAGHPPAGCLPALPENPRAWAAAEVSAAGGHHLLLAGSPGSQAAVVARLVHALLPSLDEATALEVTAVHSAARALDPACPLVTVPPFQAPGRDCDLAGIVGGSENGLVKPGAASLAHRGVLFLDHAASFETEVLDALHRPARTGVIRPANWRGSGFTGHLPARFILIAAPEPCRCAALRPGPGPCECGPAARSQRAARLSGLRGLNILRAVVTPPPLDESRFPGGPLTVVAARVAAARERAATRLAGTPWRVNAEIPADELRRLTPEPGGWEPIGRATDMSLVTGDGTADVLRVAWTIADLSGHPRPTRHDCAAALTLRTGEAL